MKNNISKIGAILVMVVTFIINMSLVSCVGVPRQQYSNNNQYRSQSSSSCGQQSSRPQKPDPYRQQSGSSGLYGQQDQLQPPKGGFPGTRQTPWKQGEVTHRRYYFNPTTRQTELVGKEKLQPGAELDAKMRASGLTPFPRELPLSETPPSGARTGNTPGNPPPIGDGAMNNGGRQPPAPPQRPTRPEEKTARPPAEVFPEIDPVTGRWLEA